MAVELVGLVWIRDEVVFWRNDQITNDLGNGFDGRNVGGNYMARATQKGEWIMIKTTAKELKAFMRDDWKSWSAGRYYEDGVFEKDFVKQVSGRLHRLISTKRLKNCPTS